ncbi:hypothetical protein [Streptomyces sp. NRRL F-5755]|uniref:hypothetical protein n=1 Tax=Streptomyces sp. NRRL F-5755 TaxID=1519475 RepID=UPI000A4E37C2|nr:hypothetical protein [Streptomyces sp. NRRL F-5755]
MSDDTLQSYLQTKQQRSRADGPRPEERAELAGLLGDTAPETDEPELGFGYAWAQARAETAFTPDEDPQRLFAAACLHGLRARLSDDIDSLDTYLPPHIATLARKVAEALEKPPPPPA